MNFRADEKVMNIPVSEKYQRCDDLSIDIDSALNLFKTHFDEINIRYSSIQRKIHHPQAHLDLIALNKLIEERQRLLDIYNKILRRFSYMTTNFSLIRHGLTQFQKLSDDYHRNHEQH